MQSSTLKVELRSHLQPCSRFPCPREFVVFICHCVSFSFSVNVGHSVDFEIESLIDLGINPKLCKYHIFYTYIHRDWGLLETSPGPVLTFIYFRWLACHNHIVTRRHSCTETPLFTLCLCCWLCLPAPHQTVEKGRSQLTHQTVFWIFTNSYCICRATKSKLTNRASVTRITEDAFWWDSKRMYLYLIEVSGAVNVCFLAWVRPNWLKKLFTDFITFTVKLAIKGQVRPHLSLIL